LLIPRTPLVGAGLLLVSGAWFTGYDVRELQPLAIAGTVWLAMDLGMPPVGTLVACGAESLLAYIVHADVVSAYHLTVERLRADIASIRTSSGLAEDAWTRYQVLQGNPALGYLFKGLSLVGALLALWLPWLGDRPAARAESEPR